MTEDLEVDEGDVIVHLAMNAIDLDENGRIVPGQSKANYNEYYSVKDREGEPHLFLDYQEARAFALLVGGMS